MNTIYQFATSVVGTGNGPTFLDDPQTHYDFAERYAFNNTSALGLAMVSLGYDQEAVEMFVAAHEWDEVADLHSWIDGVVGEAHEYKSRECAGIWI